MPTPSLIRYNTAGRWVLATACGGVQAWVIETRSASTGLNKYKASQQFFGWRLTSHSPPIAP